MGLSVKTDGAAAASGALTDALISAQSGIIMFRHSLVSTILTYSSYYLRLTHYPIGDLSLMNIRHIDNVIRIVKENKYYKHKNYENE